MENRTGFTTPGRNNVLGSLVVGIVAVSGIAAGIIALAMLITEINRGSEPILERDATQWAPMSDAEQTKALHAYWTRVRGTESSNDDRDTVSRANGDAGNESVSETIRQEIDEAGEDFFEFVGRQMVDSTLSDNQALAEEWTIGDLMYATFDT